MRFKRKWWAKQHLKYKKWRAYRDIRKKGDVVLADNSQVMYWDWHYKKKFVSTLLIWTQQMMNDIAEMSKSHEEFMLKIETDGMDS